MLSITDLENKKWKPGDTIYINKLQWGKPEIEKITETLDGDWFAGNSKFNKALEQKLIEFTGLKHFLTVNSGSAAIEIAVQTLVQKGILKAGDKVLHPTLTFPTSISSAVMAGLVPVYVDVGEGTYVIDENEAEKAFALHDIRAAIIPALLGNTPNIERLRQLLGDKPLIIDSCDVMGTKWDEREVGFYGDFTAYSFYGSHHISTFGVGGGLGTNNPDYADYARSIAFWGRDFSTDNLDMVESFLRRYAYKSVGLDAQLSAVQAAFGISQMDRLPDYLGQRNLVFRKLGDIFKRYLDYFVLPTRVSSRADISWFCYPLTLTKDAPFTREWLVKYLLDHHIEIRPIMAGNILTHEIYTNQPHHVFSSRNADIVSRRGFFIPACPMSDDQLDYYLHTVESFLKKY